MQQLLLIFKARGGSLNKAIDTINDSLSLISKLAKAVIWPLKMMGKVARSVISTTLGAIISTVKIAVGAVVGVTKTAFSLIVSGLGGIYKTAKWVFTKFMEVAKSAIFGVGEDWMGFIREADRTLGLIANEADSSFKEVKQSALRMTFGIGKALDDIQKAQFEAVSAGFRGIGEAEEIVNAASGLAIAGWTDMKNVIGTLITALSSYGWEANRAEEAASILFQTQVRGRGSMEKFAWLLANILPLARAVGWSMKDASQATAMVTKTMGTHGRVMFSVVAALRNMVEPTKTTAKAWEKYGFQVQRNEKGQLDLAKTLELLRKIVAVNGEEVLRELFKHQAALRGVSAMAGVVQKYLNETTKAMHDTAGMIRHLNKAIDLSEKRWPRVFERIRTKVAALAVGVYDLVVTTADPLLRHFSDLIEGLVDTLGAFVTSEHWKRLWKNLVELVDQFRKSEVWIDILNLTKGLLKSIAPLLEKVVSKVEEYAKSGKFLEGINRLYHEGRIKIAALRSELIKLIKKHQEEGEVIYEVIKAYENWAKAFEVLKDKAKEALELIDIDLEGISDNLWQIVSEDMPKFISSFEDTSVAEIVAGWADAISDFSETFTRGIDQVEAAITKIYPIVRAAIDGWIWSLGKFAAVLVRVVGGMAALVQWQNRFAKAKMLPGLWKAKESLSSERRQKELNPYEFDTSTESGKQREAGLQEKQKKVQRLTEQYNELDVRGEDIRKLELLLVEGLPPALDKIISAAGERSLSFAGGRTPPEYQLPAVVPEAFEKVRGGATKFREAVDKFGDHVRSFIPSVGTGVVPPLPTGLTTLPPIVFPAGDFIIPPQLDQPPPLPTGTGMVPPIPQMPSAGWASTSAGGSAFPQNISATPVPNLPLPPIPQMPSAGWAPSGGLPDLAAAANANWGTFPDPSSLAAGLTEMPESEYYKRKAGQLGTPAAGPSEGQKFGEEKQQKIDTLKETVSQLEDQQDKMSKKDKEELALLKLFLETQRVSTAQIQTMQRELQDLQNMMSRP